MVTAPPGPTVSVSRPTLVSLSSAMASPTAKPDTLVGALRASGSCSVPDALAAKAIVPVGLLPSSSVPPAIVALANRPVTCAVPPLSIRSAAALPPERTLNWPPLIVIPEA